MYKRLITCCDGTWAKPAMKDAKGDSLYTNVCYLFNAIAPKGEDGVEQLKVYDTGIGTSYKLWDRLVGGATGAGIDQKIKDCYLFLTLNYSKGDHIYLFGFSRGAYTARSLGGLIRCCGILRPEYIHLIDEAYRLYRDRNDYTKPDSDMMRSFRRNYCYEDVTRIRFIGVWDTVGALGIPLSAWKMYNKEAYKFHDTTLSSTVDYAYQALAVDEHRAEFAPVLWAASDNDEHGRTIAMEQRWFAGAHGDVGGGNPSSGLSDRTLQWMVEKAEGTGLAFDEAKFDDRKVDNLAPMDNSYTGIFKLSGWIERTIKDPAYPEQFIDESVFARIRGQKAYRPKNVIPEFFRLSDQR